MSTFADLLTESSGDLQPVLGSAPAAWYDSGMDFLFFRTRAGNYGEDRIDSFLTLLYDSGRLVGFRLKGFGHFFNQIREKLGLNKADRAAFVAALMYAFKHEGVGQSLLDQLARSPRRSGNWWSGQMKRIEAYKRASDMLEESAGSLTVDIPVTA